MTKDKIDSIVIEIMIKDGPDGHCDGHSTITEFIMSLLDKKEETWVQENGYLGCEETGS